MLLSLLLVFLGLLVERKDKPLERNFNWISNSPFLLFFSLDPDGLPAEFYKFYFSMSFEILIRLI
jgi:hypothetical protein